MCIYIKVTLPILTSFEAHLTKSTIEVHIMLRLWFFQGKPHPPFPPQPPSFSSTFYQKRPPVHNILLLWLFQDCRSPSLLSPQPPSFSSVFYHKYHRGAFMLRL